MSEVCPKRVSCLFTVTRRRAAPFLDLTLLHCASRFVVRLCQVTNSALRSDSFSLREWKASRFRAQILTWHIQLCQLRGPGPHGHWLLPHPDLDPVRVGTHPRHRTFPPPRVPSLLRQAWQHRRCRPRPCPPSRPAGRVGLHPGRAERDRRQRRVRAPAHPGHWLHWIVDVLLQRWTLERGVQVSPFCLPVVTRRADFCSQLEAHYPRNFAPDDAAVDGRELHLLLL